MKTQSTLVFQRTMSILWVVVVLAFVTTAQATTHIVQFGGSFGYTYSPNSLNVSVGDTVEWEGNFSSHPLSSTSVPAGAQSFHQATGSVFFYPVAVSGMYLYQCDFHFSMGMIGSFNATVTGIKNDQTSFQPVAFRLEQNFPNPFNPTTTISFDIPFQTYVSVKVYNLVGQEVATIVSEKMAAGSYSKIWNAASTPSGVYFYRLSAVPMARRDLVPTDSRNGQAGSFTETKKLVLLK